VSAKRRRGRRRRLERVRDIDPVPLSSAPREEPPPDQHDAIGQGTWLPFNARPVPGFAVSFAADRVGLASGGLDPQTSLVTVVGLDGSEPTGVGELMAGAGQLEWEAFPEDVAEGIMPELMRNAVHVVLSADGGLWVFLQTERELRHYDAAGNLETSAPVVADEADAIESAYLDWYSVPDNQRAYRFLSVVTDGIEIDGMLWLLWGTWEGMDGLVTVHDRSGAMVQRIHFPPLRGAEGPVAPRRFAVDASAGRVYVVGSGSSSLWTFDVPGFVQ
jgi:hypothetical protein